MPAAEASQWVDATIPKVPASSGRVVNSGISVMRATPQCSVAYIIQQHLPDPGQRPRRQLLLSAGLALPRGRAMILGY